MEGNKFLVSVCALALMAILPAEAQDFQVSGRLDSTVSFSAGDGGSGGADFSYGLEEFANIRFQTSIGEAARFYGAFNLAAVAGNATYTAEGAAYTATLELERLYFRVYGNGFDLDAGLMRLALGYDLVWGPLDFLNLRNPLSPDARSQGILGATLSIYPGTSSRVLVFGAAPQSPPDPLGGGFLAGLAGELHGGWGSLQGLYAYETPRETASPAGIHRFGISFKGDLVIMGMSAEALYTWNPGEDLDLRGLAAAAGLDYSFSGGACTLMLEYLYSGEGSSTAASLHLSNRHYLYGSFSWQIDDFTSLGFACMAALDDGSFTPVISAGFELFQGFSLSGSLMLPLDRTLFTGSAAPGEWGPQAAGRFAALSIKAQLRF
ncbi:MAG: hypothetical protein LBT11_05590 [Treponema sp.]|jgi:hypothetical protein|nr:hypothetical protein [Treponema sp.]